MKKRVLSFALVISIISSLFAVVPMVANAEIDGIYKYTIENGDAIFTGFSEMVSGDVVIPSILGGCPVTTIEEKAFDSFECVNIISITVPESVTDIKDHKFDMCHNLVSINVSEDNPNYCSVDGVLFSKDKTTLMRYTPKRSGDSYIVPDGVTTIADWAFSYCPNVTNITLPDGLINIGESAFEVCGYLSNITIPDSVTNIGNGAFKVCVSLAEINVSENNTSYCSVDGVLFNKDKTTIIQYPAAKKGTEYIIPDGVTTIGDWALGYCQSSTITIPNSVTIIGDSAFRFCNNITNIVIPDSVTKIMDYAFYGCENLIDVTIPGSVTSIGEYAFYTCDSLSNVTIPDGVIRLEWESFGYCENLTGISIPASVTGDVKSAIRDCENLTHIDVDENNLNYSSVDGVLFNKDKTTLIRYPAGKSDTIYYIPDGVTSIEKNAFERCRNLMSIVIPDGVTIIDENAFWDCEGLTNIRIPASVTIIAEDAFSGCGNLIDVFYGGTKSEWEAIDIGGYNYALEDAYGYYNCKHPWDCITYTVEDGEATITGCDYQNVRGDLLIPTTLGGCPVTAIGNGAFWDCYKLTSIIVPNSIISIGDSAFIFCDNLTSITISDSVTTIGKNAFYGCERLTDISVVENNTNYSSENGVLFNKDKTILIKYPTGKKDTAYNIPDSVTSIGYGAFWLCESLTSVIIPCGVTDIGEMAFARCLNLTNVTIPESVTNIGTEAFSNCTNLTDVTIHDGVISIGDSAFSSCTSLANINIPKGIKSIGEQTFYDCTSLTNITIPEGVTSIGNSAFSNCKNLTNITIPVSVINIDDMVFAWCANLKDVYYGGSKRDWNAILIGSSNGMLTNANITFVEPKTETTLSNNDKTFTIKPVNMKTGKIIILALYDGDRFVEMQYAIYEGDALTFTTTATYTDAKVMAWDDMTDLVPVCDAESVE